MERFLAPPTSDAIRRRQAFGLVDGVASAQVPRDHAAGMARPGLPLAARRAYEELGG